MSEWQPIKTAPKDGRKVMLFCPDAHDEADKIILGYWLHFPASTPQGQDISSWVCDGSEIWDVVPTYWMPLPLHPVSLDWVSHDGKGMPVDGASFVEVRFRGGKTPVHKDELPVMASALGCYGIPWSLWTWNDQYPEDDIIAYRVVQK